MFQQRRDKRHHLLYNLEVIDAATSQMIGHACDISRNGLMLLRESALRPGLKFDLIVVLPTVLGLGSKTLRVSTVTCWTRRDHNPSLHCVGFRFLEPDADTRTVIDLAVKLVGLADN
jgi:hypothetical protein